MAAPLEGIRVVDCSRGTAGPRLTQLLADYGAEVAWIEPPGGDPYRSALAVDYSVFNRGKRSVVLDVRTAPGVDQLLELAASADVFVGTWRPGAAERLGLGFDRLREAAPGLVVCSITGFGTDGPWRDVPGHEALVHAVVGTMGEQPGMRAAPIFEGLPFASIGAAYLGAVGVLAALYRRNIDGAGRHVETSLLDGALSYLMMLWGDSGASPAPSQPGTQRLVTRAFLCADGTYLGVHTGAVGAFGRLMTVLGLDDRIPVAATGREMGIALTPEQIGIVADEIPKLFETQPREHWLRVLRAADVCAVEHLHPCESFDTPQVRHNEMVITVDDPVIGPVEQVAPAAKFSVTPAAHPVPAPLVGADTEAVLAAWTDGRSRTPRRPTEVAPLDGVRVVDVGAYYAGPFSSRLLADLGADVIKVEPTAGDPLRGLRVVFHTASAGKRSVAVDLKDPELDGARRRLVAWADVLHHNMRPGAAERLGLGYEDARALKNDIVYLYAPGWGSTGPDRDRQSFAPKMSGFVGAGFEVAGQYNPPLFPVGNEDPGNGLLGAIGAIIALIHRQRTGAGQYVENPQLNATLTHVAHIVRRPDGEVLGAGRLDPLQLGLSAFERLYPTADGWLCLAALGVGDRAALRSVIGDRLDTAHGDDAIADVLSEAFAERPTAAWLEVLGTAGVPVAEPVVERNATNFLRDPEHHRSRRVAWCPDEELGTIREIDQLMRISDSPLPAHRMAPALGQHTDEVLAELGYTPDQLAALRERGAIR